MPRNHDTFRLILVEIVRISPPSYAARFSSNPTNKPLFNIDPMECQPKSHYHQPAANNVRD